MAGTRDSSSPLDPAQALRELASIVLSGTSLDGVLDRATDTARRALPGADDVSVTLQRGDGPATVASSGELATRLDERQYDVGRGPCLEAIATDRPVLVQDVEADDRWPLYMPAAVAAGVCSSLSLPLQVDGESVGALNVYSRGKATFGDEAVQRFAESLASYVGVALNNAVLYFSATSRAEQLAEAMRSRAVIEQAKGILMAQRRCSPEAAFDVLVTLSQHAHRKLRDVAEILVRETTENG